jgi:hypothetical protein
MSANNYHELKTHLGHQIVCVGYGSKRAQDNGEPPKNVAIECETCNEVLMDYDIEEEE